MSELGAVEQLAERVRAACALPEPASTLSLLDLGAELRAHDAEDARLREELSDLWKAAGATMSHKVIAENTRLRAALRTTREALRVKPHDSRDPVFDMICGRCGSNSINYCAHIHAREDAIAAADAVLGEAWWR